MKPPQRDARPVPAKLAALALVLVTLAAYFPATRNGFAWDDAPFLTANYNIKAADGLRRIWLTTQSSDYFPLTSSMLWFEWRLWGDNPAGYHAVNILLHAVSALLLWRALTRLKVPGAWLGAMLWAVHPVNVQSVAWIAERKNTLPMVLYAASFLAFLRFEDEGRKGQKGQGGWYAAALGLFAAALLAKTSVVMLPAALLLCAWWRRGRVGREDLKRAIPFFALSLALGLVTVWFQHHRAIGADVTVAPEGLAARIAAAGWAGWFYLWKALWPTGLTIIYPNWRIDPGSAAAWAPTVALAGLAAMLWAGRRSWARGPLFGLGYFFLTLLPMLGLIQMSFMAYSRVADHFQYQSLIGVTALVAAAGWRFCERRGREARAAGAVAAAALTLLLAGMTWRHSLDFRDDEALWRSNVAANRLSWSALNNLGVIESGRGNLETAQKLFEEAIRIAPEFADPHYNLGLAEMLQGRPAEAEREFLLAIERQPTQANAWFNLGNLRMQQGRIDEAMERYRKAIELKPGYAQAHCNLGNALLARNRFDEAVREYVEALQYDPALAEAHGNLGAALLEQGRVREAVAQLGRTISLWPEYPGGHYNMGNALAEEKRYAEAAREYRRALELAPEMLEARNNLGDVLVRAGDVAGGVAQWHEALRRRPGEPMTLLNLAMLRAAHPEARYRDGAEAARLASEACEKTQWKAAQAIGALAAALAEQGRFAEAIRRADEALALARANGRKELVAEIEAQQAGYREGRPVRRQY